MRLPENMKQELETIKEQEARPIATLIREAIAEYLEKRRKLHTLDWFISSCCSKCKEKCEIGSIEMLDCMVKRYNELKMKVTDKRKGKRIKEVIEGEGNDNKEER